MTRGRGERGALLVEVAVSVALIGVIVLIAAQLSDTVLRRLPLKRANDDRWSLSLGAVPALREDLRRSVPSPLRPRELDPGRDALVLDRSGGRGERLVVWSAERGRLGRRELRRVGDDAWEEGARHDWRGEFLPRLGWAPGRSGRRRLVELEVFAVASPPKRVLAFAFAVRP